MPSYRIERIHTIVPHEAVTKSTSTKPPHRKDLRKVLRVPSCHFCWCAQNCKKKLPAGPVFAKTQCFVSFLARRNPYTYTNAGGKKNEKRALVWRRAAKLLWARHDERAKSVGGEKK